MPKRFLGHGWSDKDRDTLFIGTLPNKKQIALYQEKDGEVKVLAYFQSQPSAQEALRILDKWIYSAWGIYT